MTQAAEFFSPARVIKAAEEVSLPTESTVIIGAPLSGKTTLLRGYVRALEKSGLRPEEILVLTPTRTSAALLRDLIALDSDQASATPRAASVTGYAFGLVSERGIRLLSGAGQEQFIRQLVDQQRSRWQSWGFDSSVPSLRGFVQELRDVFSVLIENQLDLDQIAKLQSDFPGLRLAAVRDIYPAYLERLRAEQLVDPAELSLLALKHVAKRPRALLVDDAQNFSLGQLKLVQAVLGEAVSFFFGDPDSAVLGFRNSSAASFLQLARAEGFAELILESGGRHSAAVSNLMAKISQRIPASLATGQRPRENGAEFAGATIYPSQSEEADHLAANLRRIRMQRDLSWDQMVVVGRTRTQLEQLASDLAARSVPTRIQGVQRALRDQVMARALIDFVLLARSEGSQVELVEFMTSPLIGLDSIELRRLMRQLRQQSGRNAAQTLRELLLGSQDFDAPKPLERLVVKLDQLRQLEDPTAFQAVSLGYELSGADLATMARGSGPTALAANRSIDSALELIAAAQRFDEKKLGSALDFALQQLEIAIPEDSLAPIGLRPAVQLVTPSLLSGSYPVVAIPRLQEGIWPNINPRNSLLGANSIQAYISGRISDPTMPDRSELADELRFFYRALGSASETLLLSAMADETEQPSQFFQMMGCPTSFVSEPVQFDLRQLVGRLRRKLANGDQSAAEKLAAFALAGIPGAHPSSWQGLLEPAQQGIAGVSSLAASKIEDFERCPLHWFIRTFGGDASGFSASLGTLLHSALEYSSQGIAPVEFVTENWHSLEFESVWQQRRAERTAAQMALLITEYLTDASAAVASEEGFAIAVGGLEIRGKIDRVEKTKAGFEVVDLKTGKSVPSSQEVAQNRQLGIYQLAVRQLHGEPAGARIVSVGSGKLREVAQPAITQEMEQQLLSIVGDISTQLQTGRFVAHSDEHCGTSQPCSLMLTTAVTIG